MSLPNPDPYLIKKTDLVLGDSTGTALSASTGPANVPHKELQENIDYLNTQMDTLSGDLGNSITIAEEDIFSTSGVITGSDTWEELDLSSYIPSGYRYAIINLTLEWASGSGQKYVYTRPKGSVVTDGIKVLTGRRGGYGTGQECVQVSVRVGTSGANDGILEYKINDVGGITALNIILQGYIK